MNRSKPEPSKWPVSSLYKIQYEAGIVFGQSAKNRNISRSELFATIPRAALDLFIPLCQYVDFREGCVFGYEHPDNSGSETDTKNS